MKKILPSMAMKEIQITTTLGSYLTLVKIAGIKNTNNKNVGKDVGEKEPSYTADGNVS
jgi:hypothetical protein